MQTKEGSPKLKLDLIDLKKVGVGLVLAAIGGATAAVVDYMALDLTKEALGAYYVIASTAASGMANLIRKWISDTQKTIIK